eukprot:SAG22_NODE_2303_length_2736_cov_4.228669_4_plen_140_part_00
MRVGSSSTTGVGVGRCSAAAVWSGAEERWAPLPAALVALASRATCPPLAGASGQPRSSGINSARRPGVVKPWKLSSCSSTASASDAAARFASATTTPRRLGCRSSAASAAGAVLARSRQYIASPLVLKIGLPTDMPKLS